MKRIRHLHRSTKCEIFIDRSSCDFIARGGCQVHSGGSHFKISTWTIVKSREIFRFISNAGKVLIPTREWLISTRHSEPSEYPALIQQRYSLSDRSAAPFFPSLWWRLLNSLFGGAYQCARLSQYPRAALCAIKAQQTVTHPFVTSAASLRHGTSGKNERTAYLGIHVAHLLLAWFSSGWV